MYKNILIPLDNSSVDEAILSHIRPLANLCKAKLTLIHVADGYAARLQNTLDLQDSEEIKKDRQYLEKVKSDLNKEGFDVTVFLRSGEPAQEILRIAEEEHCDLIAMSTHGHRFFKDILLGSVAENIRHRTGIPVLMIRSSHTL